MMACKAGLDSLCTLTYALESAGQPGRLASATGRYQADNPNELLTSVAIARAQYYLYV